MKNIISRLLLLLMIIIISLSLLGCTKNEDEQKQSMKSIIIHMNEINYNIMDSMNDMIRIYDTQNRNPNAWDDMGYVKKNFEKYQKEVDEIKIDEDLSTPRKDTIKRLKQDYSTLANNASIIAGSLQEFIKAGKASEPSPELKNAVLTSDEKLDTGYMTLKELGKEYNVKITAPPQYMPKNKVYNQK